MMKIRTLLIDDMTLARERMKAFLEKHQDIEIVGECANGSDAISAIAKLKPDLVFLDVQMPEVDGFEVIEIVGADQMPVVIFVTAFDEFALRAFEVSALDYLLKPFKEDRLAQALDSARRRIDIKQKAGLTSQYQELLDQVKKGSGYLKRIFIKSGEETVMLPTEDINWIGSAGNYLEIHARHKTYLFRERLGVMEQKLDPDVFTRIHRSSIVKLEFIDSMHQLFNDDHLVRLKDGTKLNMSRSYYHKLLAAQKQ